MSLGPNGAAQAVSGEQHHPPPLQDTNHLGWRNLNQLHLQQDTFEKAESSLRRGTHRAHHPPSVWVPVFCVAARLGWLSKELWFDPAGTGAGGHWGMELFCPNAKCTVPRFPCLFTQWMCSPPRSGMHSPKTHLPAPEALHPPRQPLDAVPSLMPLHPALRRLCPLPSWGLEAETVHGLFPAVSPYVPISPGLPDEEPLAK